MPSMAAAYNTKKVVVPKEVKIIREGGFCSMHSVINFTIEIGSQLESIELYGLYAIGYNLDDRTDSNNFSHGLKNLILPHTLKSVSVDGIYYCNRFTRIIYCGNHNLNQYSSTLSNKGDYTKVYITQEYETKNGNSIFGRAAEKVLNEDEIKISCLGMLPQPTPPPSPSTSPLPEWLILKAEGDGGVNVTGWKSGSGERCPTGGIEIPGRVEGKKAFENCSVGGRISLARTVRNVGARAFANTSGAEAVRLPLDLELIGKSAFGGCSGPLGDPSLVVPSSANIGEGAFDGSDFSEVMFA